MSGSRLKEILSCARDQGCILCPALRAAHIGLKGRSQFGPSQVIEQKGAQFPVGAKLKAFRPKCISRVAECLLSYVVGRGLTKSPATPDEGEQRQP